MADKVRRKRLPTDYRIACICPLPVEMTAVEGMLDEIHDGIPMKREQNVYTLGSLGGHNVVIVILPYIGNNEAASTVTQLLNDFTEIKFGLLIGIGGGVPKAADVRLGDVVVGSSTGTESGVVQYDMGKELGDGRFLRTGMLNKPPTWLTANVQKLRTENRQLDHSLTLHISNMLEKFPNMHAKYSCPATTSPDQLFIANYKHQSNSGCANCDKQQTVERVPRSTNAPQIHYGKIGSGNKVIKDAVVRDKIWDETNVLCLEMEAAGIPHDFPCLVVRGICDYADSHKNKDWQPYAAAVAAAYMKALLLIMTPFSGSQIDRGISSSASESHTAFKFGLYLADAPIMPDKMFVGRSAEVQEMEEVLQHQDSIQGHQRLVLGGIGGIGKTQLAIMYAKQHCRSHDSIFWLNAASEITLKRSIRNVAQRVLDLEICQGLDDDQLLPHITQWLTHTGNSRWLLILDNYDLPDAYDISKYCPNGENGRSIVTTRCPGKVQGQQLILCPFEDHRHGLDILSKRSERSDVMTDPYALDLVKRLQGLPLALTTMGAYLKLSQWTFREHLQAYEKLFDAGEQQTTSIPEYQNRTLYTTWDMTYTRLAADHPKAASLLLAFAFFDNQDLRYQLFRKTHAQSLAQKLSSLKSRMLYTRLYAHPGQTSFSNQLSQISSGDFTALIQVLAEHGLVEVQPETRAYRIHSCVQDWALAKQGSELQRIGFWYSFDQIAGLIDEMGLKYHDHAQSSFIVPHAMRLMHTRFDVFSDKVSRLRTNSMLEIADLLHDQKQFDTAARIYSRILAIIEGKTGYNQLVSLFLSGKLGHIYRDRDRLVEAEQMYTRALNGFEELLGPDHFITLTVQFSRMLLYLDQDKFSEIEGLFDRILAKAEKAFGENNSLTLEIMQNFGCFYHRQGRLAEAEHKYTQILAGFGKTPGPKHLSVSFNGPFIGTLSRHVVNFYLRRGKLIVMEIEVNSAKSFRSYLETLSCMGNLHRAQGKLEEAEAKQLQVLTERERVLGPTHPDTLSSLVMLALVYRDQGRLSEAEQNLDRVLRESSSTQAFDVRHRWHFDANYNLGAVYRDQGRLADAEQIFLRLLYEKKQVLQFNHSSILQMNINLGAIYVDQGRLIEAEELLTEVLAERHTIPIPISVRATYHLGRVKAYQGNTAEAEEIYDQALAGFEKVYGPEHPLMYGVYNSLGRLYASQVSKLAEAEQMHSRAVSGREKMLGPSHPATLQSSSNLGYLSAKNRPEDAERRLKQVLAKQEEMCGTASAATLRTVHRLGLVYSDQQDRLVEAEQMYNRALVGKEEALGQDHPSTLETIHCLGLLYAKQQDKQVEAEGMLARALAGRKTMLGLNHPSTLQSLECLDQLRAERTCKVTTEDATG